MREPVKGAVIKDLLAYTSARVSVCLEHRVRPSNRANSTLVFSFLSLEKRGRGLV
jgi:hypothetical protein